MPLKKSNLILELIIVCALVLVIIIYIMWDVVFSMRGQISEQHNFFEEEVFQRSVYINKSLTSLYIIEDFQLDSNIHTNLNELKITAKSIAAYFDLASTAIDTLLTKIPVDDPLLLHMQLIEIQPKLSSVREHNDTFYKSLDSIDSNDKLSLLLAENRNHISQSIAILVEYQNLYPQIQSHLISTLKTSSENILKRLNNFFYILVGMLAITGIMVFLYIYVKNQLNRALIVSHNLLEAKVEERTIALETSNQQLSKEIEERKQLEFEVRMKSDALENSLNAFDVVDDELRFVYVNKAYVQMWGYDSENEIIGMSPESHCKDPEILHEIINEVKQSGKSVKEFLARRKDNSFFDVLLYAQVAQDEKGKELYYATSIDITERKRMERELAHAQKMESIGILAGGIAHEFNNILAIIIGNTELIIDDSAESGLVKESAEEIKVAGQRARDIIKQLLTFSRHDDSEMQLLDIRHEVQEAFKLIRSSTPQNVSINLETTEKTCPVLGNATQINQLLINLCNNAIDAVPDTGGCIDIRLLTQIIEQSQVIEYSNIEPGNYVVLTIKDNGSGIDKEVLERVFDPFYTTKEVGQGSGIGLAVVHGIVERHSGAIFTDSHVGNGTTFTIYFPAAKDERIHQTHREEEIVARGNESILFVDDEQSLARLGKRLLESLGYNVETETDPERALALLRQNPARFDLIISDMAMPKLTGRDMLLEAQGIGIQAKTIICTGYNDTMSSIEAMNAGIDAFVMKPLNKNEFAQIVREVLDANC